MSTLVQGENNMKKIISIVTAALLISLGGMSTPANAETIVNVDAFVEPDGLLADCATVNAKGVSIRLAGIVGVEWRVDGRVIEVTPQASTISVPDGFHKTITATALDGYTLRELDARRDGDTLSWEHVVLPLGRACSDLAVAEQTANDYRVQAIDLRVQVNNLRARTVTLAGELAASRADTARLGARSERQAATIQRLRAKIRALR